MLKYSRTSPLLPPPPQLFDALHFFHPSLVRSFTQTHTVPPPTHTHTVPPPTYPHTHAHAQTPHQSSRNGNSIRFMFTGIMLFRRPPYIPCFFNYYLHKGFQWKSNIHEDSFLQKLVVASMGLYFR